MLAVAGNCRECGKTVEADRDSADSDATFLETGIGRGKGAGRCPGSV